MQKALCGGKTSFCLPPSGLGRCGGQTAKNIRGKDMNYTGVVYRPPFEINSLLLQVTAGCSHNRCSFCSMYRGIPFSVCPMEQVEADIEEAARRWPDTRRVFLESGDPFALSERQLSAVAGSIRRRLPRVETITMYASIRNIGGKTDAELKHLRELGINDLNIGVESGLDEVLLFMNKGYCAKEAVEQLLRLRDAGFDYSLNIILGCAGARAWRENAEKTAELLNAAQPRLVFAGTLHAEADSPLYDAMRRGAFQESTFRLLLDEQELFLERLDLEDSLYFGLHPSNVVPMRGRLPEDKTDLLAEVAEMRRRLEESLDTCPVRGDEGAILLRRTS